MAQSLMGFRCGNEIWIVNSKGWKNVTFATPSSIKTPVSYQNLRAKRARKSFMDRVCTSGSTQATNPRVPFVEISFNCVCLTLFLKLLRFELNFNLYSIEMLKTVCAQLT